MKLTLKKIALLFLLFSFAGNLMAQEDGATATANDLEGEIKTKYAQMSDLAKAKKYEEALPFLTWLMENENAVKALPAYHKNTYIYGLKIYKGLERAEKEPTKKAEYQDIILDMYQKRIDNKFPKDKAKSYYQTLGKLYYPYKNKREDFDKHAAYEYYSNLFEKLGNDIQSSVLTYYMVMSMNVNIENKNNGIQYRKKKKEDEAGAEEFKGSEDYKKFEPYTEDWMLDVYDKISGVIEYNLENAEKPEDKQSWEKTQTTIDSFLAKVVTIDCEFVKEKMGDDIRDKPEDTKLNKRAFKYMLTGKCTDEPLFLVAAINLFNAEPAPGLASVIAKKYSAAKSYDSVMIWYDKAIELSNEDPGKQAEYLLSEARLLSVQGKKSSSRTKAREAMEKDPTTANEVYELIGDLYFTSGNLCPENDPVANRAVYLRAYDMYAKAGKSSKMAKAKEQFPSVTDVFQYAAKGYKEGGAVKVGCWINESTTIRTRPK